MTTTERREKRVVEIADTALMVDINTGEIMEEKAAPAPTKKPAEKLPYNAVIVDGAACPECGNKVATARMNGKQFEVCMKQFSEEPECWYARELPKENKDGVSATEEGASHTGDSDGVDAFFDGGAEMGGAQMKTAAKTEDGADSGKSTTKKGKGKK